MSTVASPISHSVSTTGFADAGWRQSYALEGSIREKLMDSLDLFSTGFIPLVGDLENSGSTTMRMRFLDAIGFGLSMAAAADENSSVTPSNITATYAEVSIGKYSLAYLNTYVNQIVKTAGELTTDSLAEMIVRSYIATRMDAVATAIQSAPTDSGTSGTALTFDDWLDATYYFDGLEGSVPFLIGMIKGIQWSHLKAAYRDEPAFQMPEAADEVLSQAGGPGFKGVRLGIATYVSSRVANSGGNSNGAVWAPGAVVWAKGSTANIDPSAPAEKVTNLADLGLIIEKGGVAGDATGRVDGNAFFGVGLGDTELIRGMVTAQL